MNKEELVTKLAEIEYAIDNARGELTKLPQSSNVPVAYLQLAAEDALISAASKMRVLARYAKDF